MNLYQDITDTKLAKALAHPLRTRILAALEGRTASPNELATELDASLGVISYHVRRLHALGFVKLVKRVPRRGAVAHYYTATTRPRITDATWGAMPTIVKHATIKAALDQIGSYV
ncbi:MAG: ArsR/SmtB family transcription factor, partial [Solirubrobacteraceae bacterium]